MNKIVFYTILTFFAVGLYSCDLKEEFENEESKVVLMSGEWYVHYDHNVYGPDPFSVGYSQLLTFNTSADDGSQIWIDDQENFWAYKVKTLVDYPNLTFGETDTLINAVDGYDIKVLVRNGKIIEKASLRPSGTMADSIYFELWFEDLEDATAIASDTLFVSGFRRTGYLEDEP